MSVESSAAGVAGTSAVEIERNHESRNTRALVAVTLGNVLEWYDFAAYAYLSTVIAAVFFPANDPRMSLILSVGTFGVGFLMRPLGAVLIGALADRKGPKAALLFSLSLMAAATLGLGLIPPFAAIGVAAPVLVVICRLAQGLAAGGQMGGATAMLVELAPPGRTGYIASWQTASQAGALLIGALMAALVSAILSTEQMTSWGWRLPFYISIVILPLNLYIRRRVADPRESLPREPTAPTTPLIVLWRAHRTSVVRGVGITIIWTVSTYFFLVYVPLFSSTELKMSMSSGLFSNSVALAVMLVTAPIAGHLSDRIGRYRLMIASAVAMTLLVTPAFQFLISHPTFLSLVVFQVFSGALVGCFAGPAPAALAELFPVNVRSSGMGIAYNLSVALFGGFAPFAATWLIASTGNLLSPTWYVIGACGLSIISLVYRTSRLTPRTSSSGPS